MVRDIEYITVKKTQGLPEEGPGNTKKQWRRQEFSSVAALLINMVLEFLSFILNKSSIKEMNLERKICYTIHIDNGSL